MALSAERPLVDVDLRDVWLTGLCPGISRSSQEIMTGRLLMRFEPVMRLRNAINMDISRCIMTLLKHVALISLNYFLIFRVEIKKFFIYVKLCPIGQKRDIYRKMP